MPPKTAADQPDTAAATHDQTDPAPQPRRSRARRAQQALVTFAEATGLRWPKRRGPGDDKMVMRSFNLDTATIERLKATVRMIQHKTYGTELADQVPMTMNAAAREAINGWCSSYETLLNGGREAPRITRLPPGPSPEGAVRGAEKRAAARAKK